MYTHLCLIAACVERAYVCVSACEAVLKTVFEAEKGQAECGCADTLAKVENSVLKLAASEDVLESLLYVTVIQSGDTFLIRYTIAYLISECQYDKNET